MKKKLLMCILTVGLLTGCGSIPKLSNGEDALIKFSDGSMFSVDEIWNDLKSNYAIASILTKVDEKILKEEYKDKLDDMETYVNNYETYFKSNYLDENGNLDEDKMNSALAQAGYSSIDLLLKQKGLDYLEELATNDYAKTQITDKEIKKYYKNESVGDIHCLHILVKPSATDDASVEEAKNKAQEIIDAIKKDIKSGTSAEEAFKKYEKNEDVTYQDLGFFNKGEMESSFETAAYALKKGAYTTTPVKTSYGYHVILKLEEKEKDTLENLKDSIIETLAQELVSEDTTISTKAMIELRKSYGVEITDDDLDNIYNRYMNNLLNK